MFDDRGRHHAAYVVGEEVLDAAGGKGDRDGHRHEVAVIEEVPEAEPKGGRPLCSTKFLAHIYEAKRQNPHLRVACRLRTVSCSADLLI